MNIKRMIAVFLIAFILALSLSACGDKDASKSTAASTTQSKPADTGSEKATLPSDLNNDWEGPHDSSFNEINP